MLIDALEHAALPLVGGSLDVLPEILDLQQG